MKGLIEIIKEGKIKQRRKKKVKTLWKCNCYILERKILTQL